MKYRKDNIIIDTDVRNGEPFIYNLDFDIVTISELLKLQEDFKDEYIKETLGITDDNLHDSYEFAVDYIINSVRNNSNPLDTILSMGFKEVVE